MRVNCIGLKSVSSLGDLDKKPHVVKFSDCSVRVFAIGPKALMTHTLNPWDNIVVVNVVDWSIDLILECNPSLSAAKVHNQVN